jgi:hypothetical protein
MLESMSESDYQRWERDAGLLAEIGQHLSPQDLTVTVRLTRDLANRALAAWSHDDEGGSLSPSESPDRRKMRHRAGDLGLIGLAVETTGMPDGDDVTVQIDAWQVGAAIEAAEDAGLLNPPSR